MQLMKLAITVIILLTSCSRRTLTWEDFPACYKVGLASSQNIFVPDSIVKGTLLSRVMEEGTSKGFDQKKILQISRLCGEAFDYGAN